MKGKNISTLVVVIIIFFIVNQITLLSQEQEETGKKTKMDKLFKMSLEELMNVRITTAGKTAEKISDIPASVVLITREDIETYGYTSLTEILANIPGLFYTDDFGESGPTFGVRGFWSGVPNDNMIILVNGVHQVDDYYSNYPMDRIIVPVEAIDKIEVIRGPMSVVYGAGAFFGVINIITNEPRGEAENFVSVSVGSEKTKKVFARISGEGGGFRFILNASLFDTYGSDFRVADMIKDPTILPSLGLNEDSRTDGQLENLEKYFNFSGSFKDFTVDLNYSETKKEYYFLFPAIDQGTLNHTTFTQLALKYRNDLSDVVTVEGKFNYSLSRHNYDYEMLFKDFYGIQQLETSAWEAEINTFLHPTYKLDITAGIYYRSVLKASNMYDIPSFGNPFFENVHLFLAEDDEIVTRAFFTQATYSPIDSLRLVAGVRFEQSPQYELQKFQAIGTDPPEKLSEVFKQDEIEIIPRLAAIYYLNDQNIFKLIYGEAINRPSFAQNYQNTLLSHRPPLNPESIRTLELNYIATLSSKLTVNASIFQNKAENLITRVVIFENGEYDSYSDNAGETVTKGVELSLTAAPFTGFMMELSGTYQNTEDEREDFKDITVNNSPEWLGYIKAAYHSGKFSLGLTGHYVGPMDTYWDETKPSEPGSIPIGARIGDRVDGYFCLNANLRLYDLFMEGLHLNVHCSNLLDSEIRYPTFTNNDWATRGTLGAKRRFLVTLSYEW
jgi:outer membrane receptor for ferrienterochelin and colicins